MTNSERILVVCQNDALRYELADTLEQGGGYRITAVGTFDEALHELLSDEPYAMIVSEVNLPVMSGLDLLTVVGMQSNRLPVIMIDDDLVAKSALAAFRLGAVDYLCKPIDMDFMLMRVGTELERRQLLLQENDFADEAHTTKTNLREAWMNPATRPIAFVLKRSQYKFIEERLTDLKANTHATFVGLIDSAHNIVNAVGELAQTDLLSLRQALEAANSNAQLARVLHENHFSHTHFEGTNNCVFITDFGDLQPVSLVVICPADAKPGMVWLWCKRTASEIDEMLREVVVTPY